MKIGERVKIGEQKVYRFNKGFRKFLYYSFFGLSLLFLILFIIGTPIYFRIIVTIPYLVTFVFILIDAYLYQKHYELQKKQSLKWNK